MTENRTTTAFLVPMATLKDADGIAGCPGNVGIHSHEPLGLRSFRLATALAR
jgi:hypothetical protein